MMALIYMGITDDVPCDLLYWVCYVLVINNCANKWYCYAWLWIAPVELKFYEDKYQYRETQTRMSDAIVTLNVGL